MLALLEAFPVGEPVVVLLDNLESVMDTERETLTEPALHEALSAVLTAPAHCGHRDRHHPGDPDRAAEDRAGRGSGSCGWRRAWARRTPRPCCGSSTTTARLGLRDAPDELLDGLRAHTRGFPRALEAVKAILDGDRTLTPQDLLDRTRDLPEDQVVEVLVGEAYELLDPPAQQVMQALSVYPAPVSAVGVDFLLRPVNPTTNAAPILTRLVRRQLVRFHDGHYHLHPVDREYARSQLPPGSPGDAPAAFTLAGLQARAADYYTQIRTRGSPGAPRRHPAAAGRVRAALRRRRLRHRRHRARRHRLRLPQSVGPLPHPGRACTSASTAGSPTQLQRHHLTNLGTATTPGRLPAGHRPAHPGPGHRPRDRRPQGEGAAWATWELPLQPGRLPAGHRPAHPGPGHRPRRPATATAKAPPWATSGLCHYQLGRLPAGHRAAHPGPGHRPRDRRPRRRSRRAGQPGRCHSSLGDYRQAIELHTQALAIAREIGNRDGEAPTWATSGCHSSLGDYRQAIELHTQALAIARETGNRDGESAALAAWASATPAG